MTLREAFPKTTFLRIPAPKDIFSETSGIE